MQIGEFEEVVLLTVGILEGEAYGVNIRNDIKERLDRSVSIGALQVTLKRLEKKGLLKSKQGESTKIRGGRPKLYFSITASGQIAITQAYESRNRLWNALPQFKMNMG